MTQRPGRGAGGGWLMINEEGFQLVSLRGSTDQETRAHAFQQHVNKEADGSGKRAFRAADWHACVFTSEPSLCLLENGSNKTASTQFSFTPGERRRNGDYTQQRESVSGITASRFCQETAAMSKCRCAEMGRNSLGGVRLMPLRAEAPMDPAEADARIRGFREINAAFISLNSVEPFHGLVWSRRFSQRSISASTLLIIWCWGALMLLELAKLINKQLELIVCLNNTRKCNISSSEAVLRVLQMDHVIKCWRLFLDLNLEYQHFFTLSPAVVCSESRVAAAAEELKVKC